MMVSLFFIEVKAIEKNELQSYLDKGWKKGRFPNSKSKSKKKSFIN